MRIRRLFVLPLLALALHACTGEEESAKGTAELSECCQKTVTLMADVPECCRGSFLKDLAPGECCAVGMAEGTADADRSDCCKKALEIKAQLSDCCLKSMSTGVESDCCKGMLAALKQ